MNTSPVTDIEVAVLAERARLKKFPDYERKLDTRSGVLLSDQIAYYSHPDRRLIEPFSESNLRPAGYDLGVGSNYAIEGNVSPLGVGQKFEIPPYSVAVVEILETLNLPKFLIGRWNIRVKLAYKGLLWVGGAQVDPGFRGKLACPIYNLSTEPVVLEYGGRIAMIDFVTTTDFVEGEGGSIPFPWEQREKLIFQQYETSLTSGVEHKLLHLEESLKAGGEDFAQKLASQKKDQDTISSKLESDVRQNIALINGRIDTFLTLVFTVVAVLFAGLGVVATKGSDEPSFYTSPIFIASVALYLAFRSFVLADNRWGSDSSTPRIVPQSPWQSGFSLMAVRTTLKKRSAELFLCFAIILVSVCAHYFHANVSRKDVQKAVSESEAATEALKEQNKEHERQMKLLREETDVKVQDLQRQLDHFGQVSSLKNVKDK
jgi:deoxycytidine triphosphate deaminase